MCLDSNTSSPKPAVHEIRPANSTGCKDTEQGYNFWTLRDWHHEHGRCAKCWATSLAQASYSAPSAGETAKWKCIMHNVDKNRVPLCSVLKGKKRFQCPVCHLHIHTKFSRMWLAQQGFKNELKSTSNSNCFRTQATERCFWEQSRRKRQWLIENRKVTVCIYAHLWPELTLIAHWLYCIPSGLTSNKTNNVRRT